MSDNFIRDVSQIHLSSAFPEESKAAVPPAAETHTDSDNINNATDTPSSKTVSAKTAPQTYSL